MRIGFKFKWCLGYGRLYDYGYNHNHMITKEAKQRLKILRFWRKYGLQPTKDAYGIGRSTLYLWWQIYQESEYKESSLNLGSTRPKNVRKRDVNHKIITEIRRLRTEVCPNLGKDKIKILLDPFCKENKLETISASTIGRIIKEKQIYHHRRKVYHNGEVKCVKRTKKKRKPADFKVNEPGNLIELDTIVKFDYGIKRYVITAVDTYSRYSFAYSYKRATSNNAKDFFIKLKTVFPYAITHIQTDNGSEFHKYFASYVKSQKTIHFYNYKGQPHKNGHVEKYNRSIQDEFIDWHLSLLEDPDEFNKKLMDYLIWHNTVRPHWSLNLQSPVDYLIKNNHLSNMCWTDTPS